MNKSTGVLVVSGMVIIALLIGYQSITAQEEAVARFYLIPIERVDNKRGPQYFTWRFDPDPENSITCQWGMKDYGLIDRAVIAANVTQAQHDSLITHADVYAFPADIDTIMTQGEQATLTTFLEGTNVPAQWLAGQQTNREVLRIITAMFLYIQRMTAILGYVPGPEQGYALNTQYQNMQADVQAAILQAASDLGYSVTNVKANTTLRLILKDMSDQWGTKPILFGFVEL